MKLANLFLMTALVSVLAVIGCSEDNGNGNGGGGNGGSGGTVTDPCSGPLCTAGSVAEADCEAAIAACNDLPAGAGGAGGSGGSGPRFTPDQCDALGNEVFCTEGGTGGTGGDGGGGTGGTPSVTGCDESLCAMDPDRKAACEEFVPACILWCEGEGSAESCGEDECIGIALIFICNEQES